MRFKDKVAIVAGGSEGIGEGIALALGAEGAQVVVWDINEQGAQETAKKIQAGNGKAKAVKMDALDYDQVKAGVDQVVKEFGKLDIMISTVGGGKKMAFKDNTPDFFNQQVAFQLNSVFNCAHAALAPMMEKNYGKMLFFTSGTGGISGLAGYQVGKAGVESLVKTLVAELGESKSKVTVNLISPGVTDTRLTRDYFLSMPNGERIYQSVATLRPHGMNKPADVAKLALYLVSDEAERLTGQILTSSL